MEPEQIKTLLTTELSLDEVYVKVEGSHYEVIAVGHCFDGVSRVKKQQLIYAPLMAHIKDGTIHAVSIKAYTPDEWARDKKLVMPS
ncbi:BolA family protein [Flocculibacter collagenilyticus]|uniref:BolA family protein n=1 Tax=Flocculibacter collagenilyticus TaxID=2744479 RepID=UPI0018F6CE77|nr:BolA family protein [Flocculibacter collagenilyticus]